jgi:8-oxo-dGTP pyrophosphatase MutT (NUDIX family)
MINPFVEKLRRALSDPLPGEQVHQLMKARRANGEPILFNKPVTVRESGVMILLYEKNGIPFFPLIQRPEYDGVHGGQIALPGGKREKSDQDLVETALRETEEEIGIPAIDIEVIGQLSSFYVGASNFEVVPSVGVLRKTPSFVPEVAEVAEIVECAVDDFLRADAIKEKKMDVRGFPLIAPYFDVMDKVIWGATAMMLSELVAVIRKI